MTRRKTVLVLAGGDSPERDVSFDSARGIAGALVEAGYRVLVADPARPSGTPTEQLDEVFPHTGIGTEPVVPEEDVDGARCEFTRVLSAWQAYGVDVVFMGLHGGAGEDGTIQAVLEYVGVPFTGSRAAACALAMDKQRTKHLARFAGVPVVPGVVLDAGAHASGTLEQTVRETVGKPPLVVKPNAQGSSVGLSIVNSYTQLDAAVEAAFAVDDHVLVEHYIDGQELTQTYLEGQNNIPVLEICPRSGVYDYVHKYQPGQTEYRVPAPIDEGIAQLVAHSARQTIHALGLRHYARIDFRLDHEGNHYLLEANALPGMTSTSLVPKSCAAIGINYTEVCDRIVRMALAG